MSKPEKLASRLLDFIDWLDHDIARSIRVQTALGSGGCKKLQALAKMAEGIVEEGESTK